MCSLISPGRGGGSELFRSICYSQGLYSQNILGQKVAPNLVIYEKLLKNNGLVSLNFFLDS